MAHADVAQFPKHLSRNIFKELDLRFWFIFIVVFIFYNSFVFYMVVNPIQVSLEDRQAYIRQLYRVDRSVLAEIEARKRALVERQREEQKKEEVKEKQEERKQMTDAEKAKKRCYPGP